jgi:lysozyme family protein
MIIAAINGPAGLGLSRAHLGEATFVKGTNFNCNASICYGIGAAHDTLKQLQQAINSFATRARFTPIAVDGFIGTGTVTAGAQAARVALQTNPSATLLAQLSGGALSKEQVAANAPGILAALLVANSASAPAAASPTASAPASTSTSTAPTAPAPSTTDASSFTKAVDFVKSFFQPSSSPTPGGFAPAPTPGVPAAPGAAPTTAAALPAVQPKSKVPLWVWIFAGVGGVVVIGGISYAIFHKPAGAPAATAKAPAAPAPAAKAAFGRRRRHALGAPSRWQLRWAPTGQRIGVVSADSRREAIRKAPQPYRKYQGEIYAEEIG